MIYGQAMLLSICSGHDIRTLSAKTKREVVSEARSVQYIVDGWLVPVQLTDGLAKSRRPS